MALTEADNFANIVRKAKAAGHAPSDYIGEVRAIYHEYERKLQEMNKVQHFPLCTVTPLIVMVRWIL